MRNRGDTLELRKPARQVELVEAFLPYFAEESVSLLESDGWQTAAAAAQIFASTVGRSALRLPVLHRRFRRRNSFNKLIGGALIW